MPDAVVRAADGMGYRPLRRFVAVELPLALPGIVAGLRLATVSTVSLISVGALIGRGALGRLFSDGRARGIVVELWAGLIAVVVLALVLDALLVLAGRLATPWRAGRAGASMKTILDGLGWLTTADNWWGRNGIAEAAARAPVVLAAGAARRGGDRAAGRAGDRAHRSRPLPRRQRHRAVAGDPDGRRRRSAVHVAAADAVAGARRPDHPRRAADRAQHRGRHRQHPRRRARRGAGDGADRDAGAVAGRGPQRPAADHRRHPFGGQPGDRHGDDRRLRRPRHARRVHLLGQRHAAVRGRRRRVDRRDRPRARRRGGVRPAAARRRVARASGPRAPVARC